MKRQILILIATVSVVAALMSTMGPKRVPALVWNASESVPIGLYHVRPAGKLDITDLVVALPPEPLASFLAAGGYLPRDVPLIKRILALPGQTCRAAMDLPSWSTASDMDRHAPRTTAAGTVLLGRAVASSQTGRFFS